MNTTQNQNTGQDSRAGSTHSQTGNGDSLRQGTQELKQGSEELRTKATEMAKDATREGQAQVDQYRNVAAQKVDTIAESVKAAAAKLEEGDVGQWSTQIAGMADSMTRFSQGLREKSADEVMRDINRLARENPAIFVGGAVAIGFGLTRLMRATAQPRLPKESQRMHRDSHMSGGYSASSDSAYTSSTITGGSDSRPSGTPATGSGYTSGSVGGASGTGTGSSVGSGAGSSGSMGSGSGGYGSAGAGSGGSGYAAGGSGTGAGTGSTGTGLGGANSQPGQSGFAGSSGSQGNPRSGDSNPGDNDRSKSS